MWIEIIFTIGKEISNAVEARESLVDRNPGDIADELELKVEARESLVDRNCDELQYKTQSVMSRLARALWIKIAGPG